MLEAGIESESQKDRPLKARHEPWVHQALAKVSRLGNAPESQVVGFLDMVPSQSELQAEEANRGVSGGRSRTG